MAIEILEFEDFRMKKTNFKLPLLKGDITKGNLIIVNSNNSKSIIDIVKNSMIDGNSKHQYKLVYRSRNIDFSVKGKKVRVRETKERAEYYSGVRNSLGLNGIISFGSNSGKNLYYDIYRENELFFHTIPENTAKNIKAKEYIEMLKGNILNAPFVKDYTNIIMLIHIEDWDSDLNDSSNKGLDNPINMLYYAMKKELELLKSLGNVEVVIFSNSSVMKFGVQRCDERSYTAFYREVQKVSKSVIKSEDLEDNVIDVIDDRSKRHSTDSQQSELSDDDITSDNIAAIAKEKELEDPDSDTGEKIDAVLNDPAVIDAIAKNVSEPVVIKKDAISKRDMELREKQKSLKVEGKTLEELYEKRASQIPIPVNDVSGKVNTLNHEITQVQFDNFAKTYNEECYDRDIASIAYDLQGKSVPVYIRDVQKEDTSDAMNFKETWTFHLEDAHRGRHTLKFDMPKFIDGRYMYLNGHKKTFDNQRFLKPLVKTGPDVVQVCTNYNKIFMYRYGEKVESLHEKFKSLVMTDKKNFEYKRGDCSRLNKNFKTTIEYDTLAKQFAEIVVKGSPTLHLIFSQPKMKELAENFGLQKQYEECMKNDQLVAGYFDTGSSSKNRYSLFYLDPESSCQGETNVSESMNYPDEEKIENVLESIKWNIDTTEKYLYSTMEEYNIEPAEVFDIAEEGVVSTIWNGIKSLIRGVIKFLVKIWNAIVSFVKFIFNKIGNFFSSKSSSNSNFVPQRISFISMESAKVEDVEIGSIKELQEIVVEHIQSISREIRERSRIQIEDTKDLDKIIGKKEYVQERVIIGGDLILDPDNDDFQFSMPSRDIIGSRQLIRPKTFDAKSFKLLDQANDIVKEFNLWVEADIERIMKSKPVDLPGKLVQDFDTSGIEGLIQASYQGGLQCGVPKEEIIKFLKAEFYKIPDDPKSIEHLVKLRLNYNKKICKILENMLKINYAILGVTEESSKEIIKRLREGDTEAIDNVNNIINKNRSKFTKEIIDKGMKLHYFDFTPVGGGICYFTNEDTMNLRDVMFKTPERLFSLALRFDFVLFGHGGVGIDDSKRDKLADENPEYLKLWNRVSDLEWKEIDGKMVRKSDSEISLEEKEEIQNIKSRMSTLEKGNVRYWKIQPIATRTHSVTNNVNELLRNVIEEGRDMGKTTIKIFLLCCNGGHFVLDDDVRNAKGVTIVCAQNKMLAD